LGGVSSRNKLTTELRRAHKSNQGHTVEVKVKVKVTKQQRWPDIKFFKSK